jgi:thiol-disulfide isomerase/thioredoxin
VTCVCILVDTAGMMKRKLFVRAARLGLCWCLLAGSSTLCAAEGESTPVPIGQSLPDVAMAGLNGPTRQLSSFRGRPLIINVWASWCGPCKAEAASLERFAWSDAGKEYVVIGVSTDDDRYSAQRWLKQSNATLSHYIDARLVLERILGASHIPLTVLVDAGGRVVARFEGARDWDSAASETLIRDAYRAAKRPARQR